MRALTFAVCVTSWLVQSATAMAQSSEIDNSGPRTLLERAVVEGCSPPRINEALRKISFEAMADWLERGRHIDEARRIRAISASENDLFAVVEPDVRKTTLNLLASTDRGGSWDAERNLSLAATMLGGPDNLLRYVRAARDLHLAVHTAPARFLYENQGGALTGWVSEGQATASTVPVPQGLTEFETRAAFEIPYFVGTYLTRGIDYRVPVNPDQDVIIYANAQAYKAMEDTRTAEARKISSDTTIPLRQTLAAKLTNPQTNQAPPTDDADRALTYAAWLPRLCINYQTLFTPALVSRRIVGEKYIGELKAKNAW